MVDLRGEFCCGDDNAFMTAHCALGSFLFKGIFTSLADLWGKNIVLIRGFSAVRNCGAGVCLVCVQIGSLGKGSGTGDCYEHSQQSNLVMKYVIASLPDIISFHWMGAEMVFVHVVSVY